MDKRELAGDVVAHFARYSEDAPLKKYWIRIGPTFITDESTHKLADRLAEHLSSKELLIWHRQIPIEELL